MKIPNIQVTLLCLFCKAPLQAKEGIKYSSGDLIKCSQCGEENDFDSLLGVAKEEGIEKMKEPIVECIKNEFKGLFKKF